MEGDAWRTWRQANDSCNRRDYCKGIEYSGVIKTDESSLDQNAN
jgi:hypothetical protein